MQAAPPQQAQQDAAVPDHRPGGHGTPRGVGGIPQERVREISPALFARDLFTPTAAPAWHQPAGMNMHPMQSCTEYRSCRKGEEKSGRVIQHWDEARPGDTTYSSMMLFFYHYCQVCDVPLLPR